MTRAAGGLALGGRPAANLNPYDGRVSSPEIKPAGAAERQWMEAKKHELFRGDIIVSRGRVHSPLELPGFVAYVDGTPMGAAVYEIRGTQCELVSLDALRQWQGIGTALLAAVEDAARSEGCERLWLITTNDNTDAIRFYQRRGYQFADVHPGAIADSRRIKPAIPELGNFGIPIRDEVEMDKRLQRAAVP